MRRIQDERLRYAYTRVMRGNIGCIATFRYAGVDGEIELRTLWDETHARAFAQARRRWGDDWIGEPCWSNPWLIYLDLVGETRHRNEYPSRPLTQYERHMQRARQGRAA